MQVLCDVGQYAICAGAATVSVAVSPVTFTVAFVAGTVFSGLFCVDKVRQGIGKMIDKLKFEWLKNLSVISLLLTVISTEQIDLLFDTIPSVFYSAMTFLFRSGCFAALSGVKSGTIFFAGMVRIYDSIASKLKTA